VYASVFLFFHTFLLFADVPQQIIEWQQTAEQCIAANDYAGARRHYQKIIDAYPKTDYALSALHQIAVLEIESGKESGKYDAAEAAIGKILTDYSGYSGTCKSIRKIAYAYFKANQYDRSKELCRLVLMNWPNHMESMFARRDLAINHIRLGEYDQADVETARLGVDFSNNSEAGDCIGLIASYYFTPKKPEKAKELCLLALSRWPNHSKSARTLYVLASSLIKLGEFEEADLITAQLLKNYPRYPSLCEYLAKIASYYAEFGRPLKAIELYQIAKDRWPQDNAQIWVQAGLAAAALKNKDFTSAEAETNGLVFGFSVHKDFSDAVSWLGDEYLRQEQHDKAKELYELALGGNSSTSGRFRAYAGLARLYAKVGDDDKVQENLNILLKKFARERKFGGAIFEIGEEYYLLAQEAMQEGFIEKADMSYDKAIHLWQHNIEHADPHYQCLSYYNSADVYQKMRKEKEAIFCFQQVIEKWPDFEHAWNALYQIAVCYDRLYRRGELSNEEARQQIIEICSKLEKQYPNSKAAIAAESLLASYQ
jgi:tetratricopeptide (TPR) repeat protein